jgi:hypothetical protein
VDDLTNFASQSLLCEGNHVARTFNADVGAAFTDYGFASKGSIAISEIENALATHVSDDFQENRFFESVIWILVRLLWGWYVWKISLSS